ncbi:hypothetical protein [Acinetobacter phage ABPH49]|nr:hypothetical protein [Acinetobacter phage ABPH49]
MIYIVTQATAAPLAAEVKGVYTDKDRALKHYRDLEEARGKDKTIVNSWHAVPVS